MPKRLNPSNEGVFNLSEHAQNDLREIWDYYAENNLTVADKLITELFKKFQLLAQNPQLGRSRDEIFIPLRSFPYKKHIIFYVPNKSGVEIFRVIHGSRDIEELFNEMIPKK